MGMGCEWDCPACDFSFAAGHSHHTGCAQVICMHCFDQFSLPSKHPMGPAAGEELPLIFKRYNKRKKTHKDEDTGIIVRVIKEHDYLLSYDLEHSLCPHCQTGHLVMELPDDQACPQCQYPRLDKARVEY